MSATDFALLYSGVQLRCKATLDGAKVLPQEVGKILSVVGVTNPTTGTFEDAAKSVLENVESLRKFSDSTFTLSAEGQEWFSAPVSKLIRKAELGIQARRLRLEAEAEISLNEISISRPKNGKVERVAVNPFNELG